MLDGPDPVPVPAVDAVLGAFESHSLVALGEDHGSDLEHAFLRALIAEPRFAQSVDDVVVEFGNARYQALMDSYILERKNVPWAQLSRAWLWTTQRGHAWREPIYPQFFAAVRAVNSKLAAGDRIRVLLGDPPIDWARIRRYSCPRKTFLW